VQTIQQVMYVNVVVVMIQLVMSVVVTAFGHLALVITLQLIVAEVVVVVQMILLVMYVDNMLMAMSVDVIEYALVNFKTKMSSLTIIKMMVKLFLGISKPLSSYKLR
jgi:small-conductance mechanosensitive channel